MNKARLTGFPASIYIYIPKIHLTILVCFSPNIIRDKRTVKNGIVAFTEKSSEENSRVQKELETI